MNVFEEIKKLLDKNNIKYQVTEHEAVYTSEQAAIARNMPLAAGVKAMVFKTESEFIMALIAANRKIDNAKLRQQTNTSKLRFATPEELLQLTHCTPGCVPPFPQLFHLKAFIDRSVLLNEELAFNPGSHVHSIIMKKEDYLKIMEAKVVDVSV